MTIFVRLQIRPVRKGSKLQNAEQWTHGSLKKYVLGISAKEAEVFVEGSTDYFTLHKRRATSGASAGQGPADGAVNGRA